MMLGRSLLVRSRLLFGSLGRGIHSTRICHKGRRTGSEAHLPKRRPMSKKKKKRIRNERKREEAFAAKRRLPHALRPDPLGLDMNNLPASLRVIAEGSDEEILKTIAPKEEYEATMRQIAATSEKSLVPHRETSIDDIMMLAKTPFDQAATGIDLLTKSNQPKEAYLLARNLFRQMRRHGFERLEQSAVPWLAMTRCAARAAEFDDCVEIANEAFRTAPTLFEKNVDHCATEITIDLCLAAVNSGRGTTCFSIFDAGQTQALFEPFPSRDIYNILMRACTLKKLPERALGLLDEMQEYGIPRNEVTYAQLIAAAAEAPQYHRAYARLTDDILDEMDGEFPDVTPTSELYAGLITSCGRCGDARAATVYFDEMVHRHNLVRTPAVYVAYFAALAKAQSVGMRGGTLPRYIIRPPYWNLGITPEEARSRATSLDPALLANYYRSEDAVPFDAGKRTQKKKAARGRVEASYPIYKEDATSHLFERRLKNMPDLEYMKEEEEEEKDSKQLFLEALNGLGDDNDDDNDDEAQDDAISQSKFLVENEDLSEYEEAELEAMAKWEASQRATPNTEEDKSMVIEEKIETRPAPYVALDIPHLPETMGPVTRLRELGNNAEIERTAPALHKRQEAHIELAERAFETMDPRLVRPDVLNAFFSVYTEAHRRKRAREIAQKLSEEWPRHFPNQRSNRHLTVMLARRGELGAALEALDFAKERYGSEDIEAVGAVLDAHARKNDLDTCHQLVDRLLAAHTARGDLGIGASNHKPTVPRFLQDTQDMLLSAGETPRKRGPPERLLHNYRRLCRIRQVKQPETLSIDPALWRQKLSKLRRSRKHSKFVMKARAANRIFTNEIRYHK